MPGPYTVAEAVTPHDTTNFGGGKCQAIFVGVAGDITAIVGGQAILFKAVAKGVIELSATRVNATATTATDMVALYGGSQ